MTKDLPVERWPTAAREFLESETAEDSSRAPKDALLKVEQESLRVSERERVEQLWVPRLYRKVPRPLLPDPWLRLRADYIEQWCRSTSTPHRRLTPFECEWDRDPSQGDPESSFLDIDRIRCIVCGWAKGTDPDELDRWVRKWRGELEPAVRWLDPVTDRWAPGPHLLAYVTEELPAVRSQVGQSIDNWPVSPPAFLGLLRDFRPIVELLCRLHEHAVADPAKDAVDDQGNGVPYVLGDIALGDELASLQRLTARAAKWAELLSDAERGLEEMGWTVGKDGKLQARPKKSGRRAHYIGSVIRGLFAYLHPIYRRTFEDTHINTKLIRRHISQLLSQFFSRNDISPEGNGKIARAIDNFVHREKGLETLSH